MEEIILDVSEIKVVNIEVLQHWHLSVMSLGKRILEEFFFFSNCVVRDTK